MGERAEGLNVYKIPTEFVGDERDPHGGASFLARMTTVTTMLGLMSFLCLRNQTVVEFHSWSKLIFST